MAKPNQQFRPFQHLVRKDQAQPLGNGIFFRETPVTAAVSTPASDELLTARDTRAAGFGRQITLYAGEQDVTALLQVAVLPAESSDFVRLAAASPADLDKSALLTSLAGQEWAQLAPLLYVALRRARLEGRHTVVTYVRAGATLLQDMLGLVPLTRLSPVVSPTGETYLPYGQRLDIALERAFGAAEAAGHRFPSTFLMDEVTESVERWIIDLWKTRWFQAIYDGTLTRQQYVYSSAQVHQFVRWTTRILARCVASSHDKELRSHFLGHLQGEINHEVIIERDLAYLGEDVEFMMQKMVPNGPTGMFMAVQESIIGFRNDPLLLMASPLAAEGISAHLDQTFMDCLRDVVRRWGVEKPEKAMMFWSSHINTDGGESGHWQTTIDMVGQRLKTESDVARFLSVCRMSMAALTMAYDSYVEDMKVFGAEAPAQKSVAAALQAS